MPQTYMIHTEAYPHSSGAGLKVLSHPGSADKNLKKLELP